MKTGKVVGPTPCPEFCSAGTTLLFEIGDERIEIQPAQRSAALVDDDHAFGPLTVVNWLERDDLEIVVVGSAVFHDGLPEACTGEGITVLTGAHLHSVQREVSGQHQRRSLELLERDLAGVTTVGFGWVKGGVADLDDHGNDLHGFSRGSLAGEGTVADHHASKLLAFRSLAGRGCVVGEYLEPDVGVGLFLKGLVVRVGQGMHGKVRFQVDGLILPARCSDPSDRKCREGQCHKYAACFARGQSCTIHWKISFGSEHSQARCQT